MLGRPFVEVLRSTSCFAATLSTLPALVLAGVILAAAPAIAAPDTTIQSGPPPFTNTPTAQLTFTSDTGIAFECDIDNGGFAACTSPHTTAALADGPHTFSVRAIDAANVADPTPATRAWTVDLSPPIVEFAAPPTNPQFTSSPTPQFFFTATDASPVTTYCSVAGDPFTACTSPGSFITRTLPDGPYVVSVFGRDAAGNTGPTDNFAFTIDTQAPVVTIPGPPTNPSVVSTNTPTLFFQTANVPASTPIVSSVCRIYQAAPPSLLVAASPPATLCDTSFSVPLANALADGSYLFEVTVTDAAGNVGTSQSGFAVDTGAPSVTVIVPPSPVQTNNRTPSFTFSVTPGGTSVATTCRIYVPFLTPPAAVPCTSPYTSPTSLADGQYVFEVIATDSAGNIGAAFHLFQVDNVPPTVTIVAGPAGTTNDATPTFQFQRSADAVSSLCAIDDVGYVACSPSPASYTAAALASGPHTFFVKALDAAGNEASATRSFTVDVAPPDTIIVNGPPARTKQTTASFDFASEVGTTFECRLDSGAFGPCTGASDVVGAQQVGHHVTGTLAEGSHTFEVRATDAAGNVDPTPASQTWFVDLTPPVAGIATKPSDPSNVPNPLFVFTSEAGATFECSLDGAGFAPCPASYVVGPAPLTSAQHTMAVRAIDAVGNVQVAPTAYTWTVDLTPPDTTITQLGSIPSTDVVNFILTSNEPGTFECNLDGAGFVACSSAFVTPSLADGQHTLVARAIDAAGNADPTPATQTWIVDTTPPDTLLLSAPPAISHQATATFAFTATEQPATFECSLDGAAFTACTSPLTTAALADGPHAFAVRARDAAERSDPTPATHAWTVALGVSLCDGGPFVCKAPGSTKLTIRNSAKDAADKLEFRWSLGDATTSAELGDPSVDTEYAVCVWDTAGGVPSLVMAMQAPPAGNCAGKPCWRSLHDGTAFRYKDFGLLPDGVQQLTIRSGPLGKATISVKGRGLALPDPPMPFTQQPSITVQVVNGLGTCWGADYVVAPRTNTAEKLLVEEKP